MLVSGTGTIYFTHKEWSADSPTGECNVLWPGIVGNGQAGEQVLHERHATQEAKYCKTTATAQVQREQHWVESDDEEPVQVHGSATKGTEPASTKEKASVGLSAAVRLLRLLTLGSPAMVIFICLVARAKALAPIYSGASLLLQQNGRSSYAGVAEVPVHWHSRVEMEAISIAGLRKRWASFHHERSLLYSGSSGMKAAGYTSASAMAGVKPPQLLPSLPYHSKLLGDQSQSKV